MVAHLLTLFRAQFSHTAQRCTLSVAGTRRGMAYGHSNSSSKNFERVCNQCGQPGHLQYQCPERPATDMYAKRERSAGHEYSAMESRSEGRPSRPQFEQRRSSFELNGRDDEGPSPRRSEGWGDRGSRTSRYNDDGFRRDSDDSQKSYHREQRAPARDGFERRPARDGFEGRPARDGYERRPARDGFERNPNREGYGHDRRSASGRGSSSIVCYNCQQIGHHANECSQPKKCVRCGEEGHMANDCTEPDTRVCHLCNTAGHISFNCPDQVCVSCGQKGHGSRACPSNPNAGGPMRSRQRTY